MSATDTFAGPGGWSWACRLLGIPEVGIEWDAAACATRAAAGHLTIRGDVAALHPRPAEGLIASPPCPAFSQAGKGHGRDHVAALVDAVGRADWSARPHADPLVWLCLEPGRWLDAMDPEWVCMEQVPAVLPLWEAYVRLLRRRGWSAWCGILSAEQYGVPQVRKRAMLIASRVRQVDRPEPTHQAFRPGKQLEGQHSLFAAPLKPAITMAEALGWGMTTRPAQTVVSVSGGGRRPLDGGSHARSVYRSAQERGDWEPPPPGTRLDRRAGYVDGEPTRRQIDPYEEPAPTITATAFARGQYVLVPGVSDSQPNRREYDPDSEPAPTVAFGHDAARWLWRERRNDQSKSGESNPDWPLERPATTIAGRGLVPDPGTNANRFNGASKSRNDGYRVEPWEAGVLQGFPADYPWQGSQTKQFEQIGNAVPPPLAAAALAVATGRTL